METLQLIAEARILPILKIARAEDAPPQLAALCSGGINAAFVSQHTEDASAILRQGSRLFPDLLLGIDGVTTSAEALEAIHSGARMIASNGFSSDLSRICTENDCLYLPFCVSPSELLLHQSLGGRAAGIFAPEAYSGRQTVEALCEAFPRMTLIAGNIPLAKLNSYLSIGGVSACTCRDIAVGTLDDVIMRCKYALESITK